MNIPALHVHHTLQSMQTGSNLVFLAGVSLEDVRKGNGFKDGGKSDDKPGSVKCSGERNAF